MGRKGPQRVFKSSKLIEVSTVIGCTPVEILTSIQNIRSKIAHGEALKSCNGWFEDSPIAIRAQRLGKPPSRQDVIPATNASSLYNSEFATNARKR
jgi:hypothetical protein